MGLKKYEIITVGSDKRVRALRSWQVGDRYVNIGDVGGIVYDENTLSQDGACWLFRGNFGFPGARIGGDSIVDVGEATLSATGAPNVDILGSSVVVGSKLRFRADRTAADAVVLTADDFEQGMLNFVSGANWETMKSVSNNYVRTKAPIFSGGAPVTVKCDVPGYAVQGYVLDRDGNGITATASTNTGVGVTLAIPAGQYFLLRLVKNPFAPTVPADATAAKITFTGTYETKLSIVDSRVEINPATGTGTATISPGGIHTIASGAKYPETIIRNSNVSINVPGAAGRNVRLIGQIIGSNATLDATEPESLIKGQYSNVKNLLFNGLALPGLNVAAYGSIQAHDCGNMVVNPAIFPGMAAAQTANMPFIFQGCNVPDGRFYHHAQIANTYKNIDFALAQDDLGKTVPGARSLASSEVEGMYRVVSPASGTIGGLVESYDSVKSLSMASTANAYGTTIYKDAYLNGLFDFAGTNVFGNKVRSHPLAQVLNVQPRAVQGQVNATSTGQTITGVVPNAGRVTVPKPFRINGSRGLSLAGIPTGIEAVIFFTTLRGVITGLATSTGSTYGVPASKLPEYMAYVTFRKADASSLTVDDIAGVTVTVYNGCKIVNTGATAVSMKGNIRVEDNATLVNASITGTGYFGGFSTIQDGSINGCAYMKDRALWAKTSLVNEVPFSDLRMTDNARFIGDSSSVQGLRLHMKDNAKIDGGIINTQYAHVYMEGDSAVMGGSLSINSRGVVRMKDKAVIVDGTVVCIGDITLCGSYNQTGAKTWTGKRTITDVNEPEYDNNVKTQYDF